MLVILGLLHMGSGIFENPAFSLLSSFHPHMLHFRWLKTELLQNSFQVKLIRNCSVLTYWWSGSIRVSDMSMVFPVEVIVCICGGSHNTPDFDIAVWTFFKCLHVCTQILCLDVQEQRRQSLRCLCCLQHTHSDNPDPAGDISSSLEDETQSTSHSFFFFRPLICHHGCSYT